MKKKIKLFSLAIAAALVIGAAVLPAAASEKKYSSMLVLGDSISTGYGLENYTPGGSPYECRSYCNILAESSDASPSTAMRQTICLRSCLPSRSRRQRAILLWCR